MELDDSLIAPFIAACEEKFELEEGQLVSEPKQTFVVLMGMFVVERLDTAELVKERARQLNINHRLADGPLPLRQSVRFTAVIFVGGGWITVDRTYEIGEGGRMRLRRAAVKAWEKGRATSFDSIDEATTHLLRNQQALVENDAIKAVSVAMPPIPVPGSGLRRP